MQIFSNYPAIIFPATFFIPISFKKMGLVRNLHQLERVTREKKKAGDFSFSLSSKYELWTALVKDFQFETPYLAAIVDNPADIFISYFHPYHKFIAIYPCHSLRPSGESETILIIGAITPSLIGMPFKVLILKVISRIPICPNSLVGYELVFVAFVQSRIHHRLLLLLGGYVVPRISNQSHIHPILELLNEILRKSLIL